MPSVLTGEPSTLFSYEEEASTKYILKNSLED
jgi:hypothetical protein